MKAKKEPAETSIFGRWRASHKLIICFLLATIVFFIFPFKNFDGLTHIMIGWDVFSLCMLIMDWYILLKTPQADIRKEAPVEDESRIIIFAIVLVSTFASLLAVISMIAANASKSSSEIPRLIVAIISMIFSWILVHTIFTIRYAHIYYDDDEAKPEIHAGGLDFPNEKKPDFLDFAYFSFVLGMTFQVSDVEITSKRLRRLALLHGLLSFGFNTAIVALTINIIAGLGDK